MKSYIVFFILFLSQTGFSQPIEASNFDHDPYYELGGGGDGGDGKCGNSYTSDIVPDSPFGYDFTSSCTAHDRCYDTCGQIKKICDEHFRGDMNDVCRSRFGSGNAQRYTCLAVAQTYWEAVNTLGDDSYRDAQEQACR